MGQETDPGSTGDCWSRPRVLVIDDDLVILRVVARRLGRHYTVVALSSAERALGVIDRGTRFDVVLCDVLMPGMGGEAFLSEIRRRDPGLAARIIFITGAPHAEAVASFLDSIGNPRLEKPWRSEDLESAIESAL